MIAATISDHASLAHALVLAKSFKRHHADAQMVLCLTGQHHGNLPGGLFDTVIHARDVKADYDKSPLPGLHYPSIASHLKGAFLRYLTEAFPKAGSYVYLDCEIFVNGPMTELFKALKEAPIVLVPHLLEPSPPWDYDREISILNDGTFHGGMIALRQSGEGKEFGRWLEDCLNKKIDGYQAIFPDTKWLTFGPSCFHVRILKHPGYHIAAWNVHEHFRRIVNGADGTFVLEGNPLRSFHFSNFTGNLDDSLHKHYPNSEHAVNQFRLRYNNEVKKAFS